MSRENLKRLIAQGESNGDYDVVVGGARKPLREMTIKQVMEYQKDMVKRLKKQSSAVGKYQLILDTMESLVYKPGSEKLRNPNDFHPDMKFDERAQEWAADTLLNRRGFNDWANGDKTDDEFMLELSKEWASIPDPTKDNEVTSHYSGDGFHDRATPHSVSDIRAALQGPEQPATDSDVATTPEPQKFTDSPTIPTPPPAKQPQMNGMLDTGMPASPQQAAPLGQAPGAGMLMTPRGDVINPIDPQPMPQTFSF